MKQHLKCILNGRGALSLEGVWIGNKNILDINFRLFSPKKGKKTHYKIQILVLATTKMLQKPFFRPF